MFDRVNIRVPPRLIEAARESQYANREALGSREVERRVERRITEQVEVIRRARPGQDREKGGQLEFGPGPRAYQSKRRRYDERPVEVGVGFLAERPDNRVPPQTTSIQNGTGKYAIGSGDGLDWIVESFTETTAPPSTPEPPMISSPGTYVASYQYTLWLPPDSIILPINNQIIVILYQAIVDVSATITRYVVDLEGYVPPGTSFFAAGGLFTWIRGETTRSTRRQGTAYLVSKNKVERLNYPSGFVDTVYVPLAGHSNIGRIETMGVYRAPGDIVTSNIYTGLLSGWVDGVTIEQATAAYGKEIPVLWAQSGYPFDQSYFLNAAPINGQIKFGAVPGLTLADLQAGAEPQNDSLARTYRHVVSENAAIPGSLFSVPQDYYLSRNPLIIGYDYHGGTYCRDRLAELGVNLPTQ